MASKRRSFNRQQHRRPSRRIFLIATEGDKTEPQYFSRFKNSTSVQVRCLRSRHRSAPGQVLATLQAVDPEEYDEAWLVVDKDTWTNQQLQQLHQWVQKSDNRGLAVSNPKFEYWLLLHFEDGCGVSSSDDCSRRLREHYPDYEKGKDRRKISDESVTSAVDRAKTRDNPPTLDWPRQLGGTTVYRLVEKLLQR